MARVRSRRVVQMAGALLLITQPANSAPPFGKHFPHGADAVAFLYGPHGTWREQTNVYYGWNFYKHCETPTHPYDPQALLLAAATANSTAPDANCLLLGDSNNDGEITDETIGGYAFHEHAGRGVRGEQTSPAFYQFWFDDNWVAHYVATTYGRPQPSGLYDFGRALRWRAVSGDNDSSLPYPESTPYVDQIALNGLHKLNAQDFAGGLAAWNAIKGVSGATYDSALGRYRYSFSNEAIYYYGLFALLSERLLASRTEFDQRADVLQHAISLHAELLALQEKSVDGARLGWRTGTVAHALINTETTSLAVLALGAHASWVLEPGHEPLRSAAGNYAQEHERLSATAGQSVPGHVVLGPFWTLEPGRYDVEFALRSSAVRFDSPLATLDVYDGKSVLAERVIEGLEAPSGDQWRRYRLAADVVDVDNRTEFRVFWHGAYDLDVGSIRITQQPAAPALSVPPSACAAPNKSLQGPMWLKRQIETYVKNLS